MVADRLRRREEIHLDLADTAAELDVEGSGTAIFDRLAQTNVAAGLFSRVSLLLSQLGEVRPPGATPPRQHDPAARPRR
jgi:hypothetical protein